MAKYFQIPTSDYNDIWSAVLKSPKNDWKLFVNAVWQKFSETESNKAWLKREYPNITTWGQTEIMGVLSERCYSKCSNIRSSFKAKGKSLPPFPNGYRDRPGAGGRGTKAIDWDEEAEKFGL